MTGTVAGQHKAVADLSLAWPPVTSTYASPDYESYPVSPGTLTNTDPTYQLARVWRCAGDLILGNNVTIQGMLLVDGNLTIQGNTNLLTAAKNLPALYVSGDLVIEEVDNLKSRDWRLSTAASVSVRAHRTSTFLAGCSSKAASRRPLRIRQGAIVTASCTMLRHGVRTSGQGRALWSLTA